MTSQTVEACESTHAVPGLYGCASGLKWSRAVDTLAGDSDQSVQPGARSRMVWYADLLSPVLSVMWVATEPATLRAAFEAVRVWHPELCEGDGMRAPREASTWLWDEVHVVFTDGRGVGAPIATSKRAPGSAPMTCGQAARETGDLLLQMAQPLFHVLVGYGAELARGGELRAGDAVSHCGVHEVLAVAATNAASPTRARGSQFMAAGWPETLCDSCAAIVVERASDADSARMLREAMASSGLRAAWARENAEARGLNKAPPAE